MNYLRAFKGKKSLNLDFMTYSELFTIGRKIKLISNFQFKLIINRNHSHYSTEGSRNTSQQEQLKKPISET